ncbi:MAG: N-acetyltransferase family protein [Bacteroidales bacterium]
MVIRDYRKGDYKQVLELWKATGIYDPERGDSESAILRCNELGGKFLVMEDPDTGTVEGTSWMSYDGRRIHLHHFAIRPELQGKGLGRTLAGESLRFAEEKGCPVKLEVHRENLRALHLYEKFGFRIFKDYLILMNRHT